MHSGRDFAQNDEQYIYLAIHLSMKQLSILMIVLLLSTHVLLSWCASSEATDTTRQEFVIRTQQLSKTDFQWVITKTARVQWTSEVTLTSQVGGRVGSIVTTLWSRVSPGTLLVSLQDTQWTVSFGADKAQLAATLARQNYETQRLMLQKQIADATIAYERSQSAYETTQADIARQLDKARRDLASTTDTETWSITNLQIQKLQKDLEKAEFDYETKLKADAQTRENLTISTKTIHADLTTLLTDVLDQSDRLLGVTIANEHLNDDFDIYLGARDVNGKNTAVLSFYALNNLKTNLTSLSPDGIDTSNVEEYLNSYKPIIDGINTMLSDIKNVLIQSISSADRFPQSQIDGLTTTFNALQTRSSTLFTAINNQLSTSRNFFATYRENQESLQKNIDLLRDQIAITTKQLQDSAYTTQVGYDRTKIAADNQLINAELNVKSSQLARDLSLNTKDESLAIYDATRRQAEVAAQEAVFNRDKFAIQSPLDATVADILVDIGQDINPGTALVKLVSRSQQIELFVNESERKGIEIWQIVTVTNDDVLQQWVIASLATVADKWGNYKVIISLPEDAFTVGSFVHVSIPLQEWNIILPLNSIDIVDVNRGQVNLWNGTEIIRKTVELGQFFGDMVEVTSSIPLTEQLILSDVSNYDPTTMQMKIEQVMSPLPLQEDEDRNDS